jgi:hypothetical protein
MMIEYDTAGRKHAKSKTAGQSHHTVSDLQDSHFLW